MGGDAEVLRTGMRQTVKGGDIISYRHGGTDESRLPLLREWRLLVREYMTSATLMQVQRYAEHLVMRGNIYT